ncbi:hypothetical protein [Brevundimonas vesicularis]|uniref:hypothetical protein n=1 Tax=Brevundimonas vesicularis TaxID=41276 RepID=UPI0038D4F241
MIDSDVRATIAAIALAHATDKAISGLFDHSQNRLAKVTAVFDGPAFDGLDLARRAKLSGTLPDIYDHGRSGYIHLSPTGDRYTVYDHKSGTHAYVVVAGETASLYDHDAATWSQYSLKPVEGLAAF